MDGRSDCLGRGRDWGSYAEMEHVKAELIERYHACENAAEAAALLAEIAAVQAEMMRVSV